MNLIAYVLDGHDNDSHMLLGCLNLVRCSVCGELLERPGLVASFRPKRKLDVSATYDSYTIVSKRFVDEWVRIGGVGLEFTQLPAEPGHFVLHANKVVAFDSDRRKTRFEKYRPCCGRYHSITGATPAYLKPPVSISPTRAARTDLMFGSGDEKAPMIIIPLELGKALKRAKLSGLDLAMVLG